MAATGFIVGRVLRCIPVVLGVTLLVFLLIHLVPGSPARTALGPRATPAAVADLERSWGLDRPLPDQYALYLERLAHGDLGTSTTYHRPTRELIAERLPVTLWLVVYGGLLACCVAVPLALLAAARPGGGRDAAVRGVGVAALAVPSFWLGIMLVEQVALRTGLFPPSGFGDGFGDHVAAMFLPGVTVAAAVFPLLVRSLRAEMLKVARAEYVVAARAKGLSPRRVWARHILRNALGPGIAVLAINLGFLIGGTVVVEKVFSLPGLGDLMLQAISRRDFQVVQGVSARLLQGFPEER